MVSVDAAGATLVTHRDHATEVGHEVVPVVAIVDPHYLVLRGVET